MRFRTPSVFGFAFVLVAIAGCAATRHPGSNLERWSSQSSTCVAEPQTTCFGYGFSHSPYQPAPAKGAADDSSKGEFDFSHPRVDNFVTRFQTSLRQFYTRALSRSGRYVPRMSSILQKKGLPQELAYLPLIESGYSPHAVSRAGAVGPWQLIPGTGRRYGLRIDRYVDERRDPVKSTEAAAEYLKDLHDMFGDWHLSLAAYNTGEQNIARILERRRIESFWEMSERGYLYQETSDFVPEFLAALQIAEAPEEYGFDAPDEEPAQYDIIKVNRSLSLSTVARLAGTSTQTVQELNPALRRGVTPPNGYAIRVPKGTREGVEIALANLPTTAVVRTTRKKRRSTVHRKHRARRTRGVASAAKTHHAAVARSKRRHVAVARSNRSPVQVARKKTASKLLE
jgi:membrane-bound lytic murein transglycosylase D